MITNVICCQPSLRSRYVLSPSLSSCCCVNSVSIPRLRCPINNTCTSVELTAHDGELARRRTSQAEATKTSTSSPEKRRRAKDTDAAAAAIARDANYHVSMATDCVLVAAVTGLVSSQLARKQVNGAERAAGACCGAAK